MICPIPEEPWLEIDTRVLLGVPKMELKERDRLSQLRERDERLEAFDCCL